MQCGSGRLESYQVSEILPLYHFSYMRQQKIANDLESLSLQESSFERLPRRCGDNGMAYSLRIKSTTFLHKQENIVNIN